MDESPFKLVINKTAFLGINFEFDNKNRLQICPYDEISPRNNLWGGHDCDENHKNKSSTGAEGPMKFPKKI